MTTKQVRELARSLGAAGVGYYPTSRFVHVDVRDEPYQWTDTSGPGENADDSQTPEREAPSAAPSASNAPPANLSAAMKADGGPQRPAPIARTAPGAPPDVSP
jgi:hypothetical protein